MNDNISKEPGEKYPQIFFLILICAYAACMPSRIRALFYIIFFVAVFAVLLYYHMSDVPAVRASVYIGFYVWVGLDGNCYIFEDISIYSRYFYLLATIIECLYLYHIWKSSGSRVVHIWASAVVEFLFWGFAILYKIEAGTAPILQTIVLTVIFYIWSAGFVNAAIFLLELAVSKLKKTNIEQQDHRHIWISVFLILVIGGGLFSVIFYPGVISFDTVSIYEAAMALGDAAARTDIHSFAYTCLEKFIFSICDSFYFLTWVLMIAFSAAWASFVTNICRLGLNRRIAYGVTLSLLFVPGSLYMLITTWKDTPFAICMMITGNMLMKISSYGDGFYWRRSDYVVLVLGIIGMAVFRSNGQFVLFALIIAGVLFALKSKKERRAVIMLSAAITAGIIVLLIKGPLYSILQVDGTPSSFVALPFVDGIWENVEYGGKPPDEAVAFVEENIMPVGEFKENYREDYLNVYSFPEGTEIPLEAAIKTWVICFKGDPFITLMARLRRSYNLWSVFPRGKLPTATNYVMEIGDYSDLEYLSFPLLKTLRRLFRVCYSDGWLYGSFCYIISRGGWNIFLWIVLGSLLKTRGMGDRRIMIFPASANTIALMTACCFNDYRFMYPMFVLTLLYAMYVFQICAVDDKKQETEAKKTCQSESRVMGAQ